ncbi:mediator of RNA polymerase II transcription subunit 19-like isoform X3 [Narcine bancroftii]|uniref:mediator of RNA polymerase II transcription subunit 19-like isoform X3 n=1 Tax=Narcine bancroftii TaxID=1343680 RepID=UPI0038322007
MDAMNTLFSPADATMLASASPAMGPYGKQQQQPPPPLPPPPQQGSMTADEGTRKAAGGVINGPFYVMRELPAGTELTANNNLITHYNLEHAYNKFCGKKVKDKLSNFIPDLPGMIDLPGSQDNSSLRSLIEKPPICGNSFTLLTGTLLTGFRLHTGPLPEQYRLMHVQPPRKKNRHKHKHSRTQDPVPPETPSDSDHKKKKKKRDDDPDRKKKKKEKKKKKNRHSPEHPSLGGAQTGNSLR